MRRLRIAFSIAALLIAVLTAAAGAATFRGRNVDGRWFAGSAFNQYAGRYDDVRIKFSGETAYVRFGSGSTLMLSLREEVIADPTEIEADDHRRGLHWMLKVQDLGSK